MPHRSVSVHLPTQELPASPSPLDTWRGKGISGLLVLNARWRLRSAAQLGARVRLWGRPVLQNEGTLTIGERVRLVSTVTPIELVTGRSGTLEIGARTFINYGSSIGALHHVVIGPCCNIGSYVMILDNNFHRLEPTRRLERPPSAPIILEENVWLGSRVIVLPGVRIGANSVVGAGSIVTHDIPSNTLAAGVPARVIRSL